MSDGEIGVWTAGIKDGIINGPSLAIKRMLKAMDDMDISNRIVCLHHEHSDDEIYDMYDDVIVDSSVIHKRRDGLNAVDREFDTILEKSIPATFRDFAYHVEMSSEYTKRTWVHGTSSFVPKHAYGERLEPTEFMEKFHNRKSRELQKAVVRQYDRIATNTEFTKQVLIESMNVSEEKIDVIHYGVNHDVFRRYSESKTDSTAEKLGITTPSILYVANYTPRKSPLTVVQAFKSLRRRGFDHSLVIVGDRYEKSPIKRYVKDSGIKENVVFTGYQDEKTVAKLYNIADVFVFPTLHETFGMPVLESMAAGCPVVSSDYTSIPEVSGGTAELLSNPTDSAELADAVARVLDDETLRQQLINDGKEWADKFTWAQCARDFVSFL